MIELISKRLSTTISINDSMYCGSILFDKQIISQLSSLSNMEDEEDIKDTLYNIVGQMSISHNGNCDGVMDVNYTGGRIYIKYNAFDEYKHRGVDDKTIKLIKKLINLPDLIVRSRMMDSYVDYINSIDGNIEIDSEIEVSGKKIEYREFIISETGKNKKHMLLNISI